MKNKRIIALILTVIMCISVVSTLSACGGGSKNEDPETAPIPMDTPEPPTPPPPTPEPSPEPINLVEYDTSLPVEHIFFHEVIAFPEMAFDGGSRAGQYDEEMVTVQEFNLILESLYRNNFILVDLNEVWEEFTNENGNLRMRRSTLMLPEGKKPIVISFDDLSFYNYMNNDGFMTRYIIGPDGEVWAEGYDPAGNPVMSQELAAITILDRFIEENPRFSHNGAKGCIAFTGYEGILGYRTQFDRDNTSEEFRLNRMKEIARVQPVVQRLKETGWYFASHSYGHIWLDNSSLDRVKNDAARWEEEVRSLLGDTIIFIYPYGSRLDGSDIFRDTPGPALRHYVDELGFRMFLSVGREPFARARTDISAVFMDRMLVGGTTLRGARDRYLKFFDAAEVFDNMRPEGTVPWGGSYSDDDD